MSDLACSECGGSGSVRIRSHEDYGGSFECEECEPCAGTGDLGKAAARVLEESYRELMADGGGFDAESVLSIAKERGWVLVRPRSLEEGQRHIVRTAVKCLEDDNWLTIADQLRHSFDPPVYT